MKLLPEVDDRAIKLGHFPRVAHFENVDDSTVWLLPSGTAAICFHCRKSVNGSVTFFVQTWTNHPRFNDYWHLRCIQIGSPLYIFIMKKAKEQPVLLQQIILESAKFREWA